MQYFGASVLALLGLANSLQCTEVNGGHNTWSSGPRVRLEVHPHIEEWPHSGGHPSKKLVLHKKNEPLNMTCTVVHQDGEKEDTFFDYIVDWKGPRHITNNPKIETGQSRNMAWIWFERLAEKDAGDYSCMAVSHKPYEHQSTLSIFFYLFVEHKPMYCGPQWYRCHSKNCIMERYVCDGKKDCEEGEDESSSAGCGDDPCHGKILCEDRCIPAEWCCDHRNCSGTFGLRPWPHENHEISYVQTAFYTVIGCAMAFMFIVTILVIAICRVQIKRAMNSRCTQQNRNPCARRTVPLYDLDVYLNRTADVNYPGGVSIMYNINSGVQFVGRPAEPPPYSAVVAEPPREGPPPPYASCENLIVRQLNPRFIEGADATSASDANPAALGINQSITETGANLPDTDIRGVAAQSNTSTNGQRDSLLPNVPGPQVANHATCITQPRVIDSRDVFTAWASSNALHSRDSVDAPLTVTTESPRTHVQQPPPPNFELEYVETDALLAENASNNPAIQSSKNIVWKPYSRHALMKSRWLNNARSDKTPEKHWYRQRVEKAVQECPSRGRDVSTSRDSANEGVFLDTDQQDSTPAESTSSAESDIAAGFAPFVDIVDAPKASCDKVTDNVAPSCSKAVAQSDVSSVGVHAQEGRRESLLAEHNANLKALKSEAKASRKEKCKSEVISDRASQVVPSDKSFRRAIKRQSSLTSDEIRSKNLSESSASASAGNVNAASSRVADNEGNKQIREVSSLVLPLRESFIGVQRDS